MLLRYSHSLQFFQLAIRLGIISALAEHPNIPGGGTAGLVVAARLSENPIIKVGVIEAGSLHLDEPLIDTPELLGEALFNSEFDWSFSTMPQKHANGRMVQANRGKMLGGSSGLNFMVWQRASKPEYDAWRELGAGDTWDWDGLLPFLKKSSTVVPGPSGIFPGLTRRPGSDDTVEGRTGPVHASYNNFYTTLVTPFVESFLRSGGSLNSDPDSGNSTGIFNAARSVDVRTGNRSNAANAYFLPNAARGNLKVLVGAQATKITLKPKGRFVVATGVDFVSGSKQFHVHASKEMVLSAGAFQTPQLLELSGIGNRSLLNSLRIPTILDLPSVGQNLQDHISVSIDFLLKDPPPITFDSLTSNSTFASEEEQLYRLNHTGAFTGTPAAVSFNPISVLFNTTEREALIRQLEEELSIAQLPPSQQRQYAVQLDLLKQDQVGQMETILDAKEFGAPPIPPVPGEKYATIVVFGSRLFSRGTVHINTTNPLAPPLIDPNYLQFSFDRQIMVQAIKFGQVISRSQPFASLLKGPHNPSANMTSNEDLEAYVTENFSTEWHPIGTASLGPKDDGGVVDSKLIVYGTTNLRVIDASVIPLHIAAHIQTTVYAIAEKAVQMILDG